MPAFLSRPETREVIGAIRIRKSTKKRSSTGKKRQESSAPLPGSTDRPTASATSSSALTSPGSSLTTSQLPLPSSGFSPPNPSSPPPPSLATISQALSSTSTTITGRPGSDGPRATEHRTVDTKAIVFGVTGGLLGLILLGLIAFHLLPRYKQKSRKAVRHESFWDNWHWGTYSPLHGDVILVNHDTNNTNGGTSEGLNESDGGRSKEPYAWWRKFNFAAVSDATNGEEGKKKKKQKATTLYKVRSLKPGEKFEIDSCASLEIVDLTSGASSR